MLEFIGVAIISHAVSILPLQIIGFITPYWACGKMIDFDLRTTTTESYLTNNQYNRTTITTQSSSVSYQSCNLEGLFYTCTGSSCHGSVLDSSLLGLCLTSLIVTCGTVGYMIMHTRDQMDTNGYLQWTIALNTETVTFIIFVIGQLLAGIAALIIFNTYQVMGWSAILFTTLALPIDIIASIIICILLEICLKATCCKD